MKLVSHLAACVLVVVAIGSPALCAPQKSDESAQIVSFERAFAKTAVDHDAAAMAKFMADEYIEITMETDAAANKARWKIATKAEWVELVRSGKEKYQSVELRNLKVYFHGDVATVTGEYSQSGTREGIDISATGLYVDTWVKKNGIWHVVSSVFP
jgi:ketosteroid isomerase-like protein